jgi:hypothetical protein
MEIVMKLAPTDVEQAEKLATELHELLERLVEKSSDYDIARVLKKSEAELMDMRHNLAVVKRLLS